MKVAVFSYADTLTGGNLRLIRAFRYYPKDFYLFIPSDKYDRLKGILEVIDPFSLDYLEKRAVMLKPMGRLKSILSYYKYGKYVAKSAKDYGADLLFLYHENVYFPFGFESGNAKWTMLLQQTPVLGSMVIEEGKGFKLFKENYEKIYGYGFLKSIKGYLRLKAFDFSTKDRTLISSSKSTPYELNLLGVRKNFITLNVPSGTDGCLKKSNNKDVDVAFFSRVVYEKGIFDFINVLSLLKTHLKKAYIIGFADDEMKKIVEKELTANGLDFVETLFNANKEEAHEALSRSKLLVYPSKMDSFSLSLMESLSCGTPAVAYAIPGIRFNYDTKAVKLVKPLDYKALADEALKVLKSGEWEEMSRVGLEYSKRFTWEAMVEDEVKAISKIVNKS